MQLPIISITDRGEVMFPGSHSKQVAELGLHPGFPDPGTQLLPGPGVRGSVLSKSPGGRCLSEA